MNARYITIGFLLSLSMTSPFARDVRLPARIPAVSGVHRAFLANPGHGAMLNQRLLEPDGIVLS
jgi:hypothetical protein